MDKIEFIPRGNHRVIVCCGSERLGDIFEDADGWAYHDGPVLTDGATRETGGHFPSLQECKASLSVTP